MPNYINGAVTNSGASTVTTLNLTYSPAPGNFVVLGVHAGGGITAITCVDNLGNSYASPASASAQKLFTGVAAVGVTGYTISWTTLRIASAFVGEYSLFTGIGTTNQSASATSTNPTITVTPQQLNSAIIATIGESVGNLAVTQLTGNIRLNAQNGVGNANGMQLVDNISSSFSVTVAVTAASSTWGILAFELLPGGPLFSGSAITADFHWGGGDGL
jgi:hypothetical protein